MFIDNLENYFNNIQYSDIDITIKSNENDNNPLLIKGHKMFLSLSSEYFKTKFETKMGKNNEVLIIYDNKNIMYDTIASIYGKKSNIGNYDKYEYLLNFAICQDFLLLKNKFDFLRHDVITSTEYNVLFDLIKIYPNNEILHECLLKKYKKEYVMEENNKKILKEIEDNNTLICRKYALVFELNLYNKNEKDIMYTKATYFDTFYNSEKNILLLVEFDKLMIIDLTNNINHHLSIPCENTICFSLNDDYFIVVSKKQMFLLDMSELKKNNYQNVDNLWIKKEINNITISLYSKIYFLDENNFIICGINEYNRYNDSNDDNDDESNNRKNDNIAFVYHNLITNTTKTINFGNHEPIKNILFAQEVAIGNISGEKFFLIVGKCMATIFSFENEVLKLIYYKNIGNIRKCLTNKSKNKLIILTSDNDLNIWDIKNFSLKNKKSLTFKTKYSISIFNAQINLIISKDEKIMVIIETDLLNCLQKYDLNSLERLNEILLDKKIPNFIE